MRTARRALTTLTLTSVLAFGALAPTASASSTAVAPTSQAKHVSAWLCVVGGGQVVHYPWIKVCVGGLFHGHIVI